jgi:hypothetical protein
VHVGLTVLFPEFETPKILVQIETVITLAKSRAEVSLQDDDLANGFLDGVRHSESEGQAAILAVWDVINRMRDSLV